MSSDTDSEQHPASIESERLKNLYQENSVARLILDQAARRQRNQSETKVDRIIALLAAQGHDVSRGEVIESFRRLEDLGAGQFVSGRHGWPSRFVWSVGMVSVGKAAAGEPQEIESISPENVEEEIGSVVLSHSFYLRADTLVTVDLLVDLTKGEGEG